MNKQKKGLAISLSLRVLFVVFAMFAIFATQASTPLVTSFGVEEQLLDTKMIPMY